MKNYRMVAVLAVFAALLALVPMSLAQDLTFGLSQDDFNALTAANAATASATSAQFSFTANLTASAEGESGVVNINGTGAYDVSGLFQLAVDGSAVSGSDSTPLNAELRVVGGSVFVNLPAMLGPQWLEITPAELGQMTEGMTSSLPFSPDALASGDVEGVEGVNEALMALATLQPEQYVSIVRSGDQFTTTLDLVGLLGSEEIANAIRSGIAENADAAELSEAEINTILSNLPTALQGSSATLDQYVTDGLISRTVLNLALNVDPSVLGEEGEAVSIGLNFDISLSGHNQPVSIAAPQNSMLLSEMMGGQ